jgi:HK97 family phage prohead protease
MERGRLIVALEQKAVTGTGPGEISGLASVYGNVDLQDDIMERGALDRSIANHQGKAASKIPLLDWHGDSLGRLIGSAKELRSVPEGVWFKAGFSSTPEAQRARQLAQEGHLSGVSIGYLPIRQSFKTAGGKNVRVLHEVRLLEISLTPVPANPLAQVASVKAGDSSKPYGDVAYADPGYKDDGQKRYPIDTEAHCRAAWSYINMPGNQAGYTAEQVAAIKGRIRAAMEKFGMQVSAALDYGQFADAMRKILEVPFEPARKAAADVLLDQFQPETPGPADEPDPADDAPAPSEGTAEPPGDDNAAYALAVIAKSSGPPDGAPGSDPPARALAGPLAQLETERAARDMDRLEAEILSARGGTS